MSDFATNLWNMLDGRYEGRRQVDHTAIIERVDRDTNRQVRSVRARVQGASNVTVQGVSPNATTLAAGQVIAVENVGSAAAPSWMLRASALSGAVGLPTVYQFNESIGSYNGGDLLLGLDTAGNANFFFDESNGSFTGRIGTTETLGLLAAQSAAFVGNRTGPHVYIDSSGVAIKNATVNLMTLDGTNGIRQYSGGVQRSWLKQDGSGWFVASNKFSWDTSGNITLSGTINASGGAFSGLVQIGSGTPHLHLDGAQALLESSNYVAGSAGWRIDSAGNAELNNATVRGAIKSAVFEKSEVSAFAGSQIVAKSASAIFEDCVLSGTTYTLKVLKQNGAAPFANTDIVRIKAGTVDTWATVNAGTDGTTHWVYTATYQSGTSAGTVAAGQAIVNYGQSGQGYYIVSADGLLGASAAWALRSHAGAPWATETTHVYAGTDGKLYTGGGLVCLSSSGMRLQAGYSSFLFLEGSENVGSISSPAESSLYHVTDISAVSASIDSAAARVSLSAFGLDDVRHSRLIVNGDESYPSVSVELSSGGYAYHPLSATKDGLKASALIVNDTGLDLDSRIEGDTDANLIFVDASTDRVGIGTATPNEKLEVAGSMRYTGEVKPVRGGTAYTGSVFVPLTSSLGSTSWDGDSRSTTSKTLIDLSAVFGIPGGVKAILVSVVVRDSASASGDYRLILGPTNTAGAGVDFIATRVANDYLTTFTPTIVTCDANGDVYYQVTASGTNTLDAWINIWGYWI